MKIISLIILILDIIAVIKILQSGAEVVEKALWILLVVILPLVGLVIWALLGPGSPAKGSRL